MLGTHSSLTSGPLAHRYAAVAERPRWTASRGVSEEHLPLEIPPGEDAPPRGTAVLLLPRHICPSVNLHEEAVLVHEDDTLEVVPVAARAHAPWF